MPKIGQGEKIDKAKAILKKFAIPIAGFAAATIVAIATALSKKDNGEAFVFQSLSDLSPEEFRKMMGPGRDAGPQIIDVGGKGEEPKERPKRTKATKWIEHVKNYAKEHDVCYREALKGAGATYVDRKKK